MIMIKRRLETELVKHLSQPEITILTGPRQAGKTTLLNRLQTYVQEQGSRSVYLNLDIRADYQYFDFQEHLLQKIRLEFGQDSGVVFIDEIQRKEDAALFLKGIYDMNLPYKFVVSGSGSLELKAQVKESLAGRKRLFALSTVTFEEFLDYKTAYQYSGRFSELVAADYDQVLNLFNEYLSFGGYPRVVLAQSHAEKLQIISELYQSYVEKDIQALLSIRKTDDFGDLFRVLAGQVGQLTNVLELANTLGLSQDTVKTYLGYMRQTYMVERVRPFAKNIRKELTKMPVYYFTDLGMRNFALGRFELSNRPNLDGMLFQNAVYQLVKQQVVDIQTQIYFWRTKDKAEVDLLLERDNLLTPIEIKASKQTRLPRSLQSFINTYNPPQAYIVHIGPSEVMSYQNTKVYLVNVLGLVHSPLPMN